MRTLQRSKYLLALLAVLILLGCSENVNIDVNTHSKDSVSDLISKSLKDFKNRPIYKGMTEQIIDNTSDENLLQVIFDNLSQKTSDDHEKEYENVMTWNQSQQAIYMIWLLEAEVNNGGYNQFYFNSSGQFYKHLPGALNLVGANKFSKLTKQANDVFEKDKKQITKYWNGTVEGFSRSYDNNPLNKYDDKFYELYNEENLQQIQVDFIRKHKSDFLDN